MTQRLPVPGGDNGTWGDILNGFLEVSLNADGTLSTSALSQAGGVLTSSIGQPSGVAGLNSSGLVPTTQLATGTASSSNFLRGDGTWVTPNSGSSALAADSDVAIVSPSNNQVLTYVSGSGKWENIAPAVATVFGRTGAITATTGDYTASQVTGALVNTNNLSDVSDAGSSRANIHIPVLTPAAAVAVANVSLTAPGLTCDGYSFTSGDILLLTAQNTASQNGPYIWTGASTALTRPTEFPTNATVKGRTIEVQSGTNYGGTVWALTTTTAGIVVDTESQVWAIVRDLARSAATTVVAASNSPSWNQKAADYVCTGTNDDVTINLALAKGGRIILCVGDYYCGVGGTNFVNVSVAGTMLQGNGSFEAATRIHAPAGFSAPAIIKVASVQTTTIRDLQVLNDSPAGCQNYGIWMLSNSGRILHCVASNTGSSGFVIDGTNGNSSYQVLVFDCAAVFCGQGLTASGGIPGDGFVFTQYTANCIIDTCWCEGGTGCVTAQLGTALTSGSNYTSLTVTQAMAVTSGDLLIINTPSASIGASQYQVVTASAASSGTTITVTSFTANANYAANATIVSDLTRMNTRTGLAVNGSTGLHVNNFHPYYCFEAGLNGPGANNFVIYILGCEFENCGWISCNIYGAQHSSVQDTTFYGSPASASLRVSECNNSVVSGNVIQGGTAATNACNFNFNSYCVLADNVMIYGGQNGGQVLNINSSSYCAITGNMIYPTDTGTYSVAIGTVTYCIITGNMIAEDSLPVNIYGTNTGTVVRNNTGIDPVGNQSLSLSTTTAIGTSLYDRYIYITAGTGSVSCAITAVGSSSTIVIPASTLAMLFIPAGYNMTPTFTGSPTAVSYAT